MTPSEFKVIWTQDDNSLCPISIDRLNDLNLKQATIDFLTVAGLPDNVAPYLSFIKDTDDKYFGINRLTKQYDFLESEYEKFVVIGSDGSGNPIAINTSMNDRIEWLDHEDLFSSRYLNNSINQLAEILIIYKNFITQILLENGEDAYMDANFSDSHFENLKQKIVNVDSIALIEEGFWKEELEMLLVNREYYAKK
ncbi:MAG: SUKH-4 family immunity protein [Bacteroidota bacterium]